MVDDLSRLARGISWVAAALEPTRVSLAASRTGTTKTDHDVTGPRWPT